MRLATLLDPIAMFLPVATAVLLLVTDVPRDAAPADATTTAPAAPVTARHGEVVAPVQGRSGQPSVVHRGSLAMRVLLTRQLALAPGASRDAGEKDVEAALSGAREDVAAFLEACAGLTGPRPDFARLLSGLRYQALEEHLPAIAPLISSSDTAIASAALEVAAGIDSPEAATLFLDSIDRVGLELAERALIYMGVHARQPDVMFPRLFRYLPDDDVVDVAADYCVEGKLTAAHVGPHVDAIVAAWEHYAGERFERHTRLKALTLLGCVRDPRARSILEAALELPELSEARAAALALLRSGGAVPPALFARLAEAPGERGDLFDALSTLKRLDLMPRHLRTQEALARADLLTSIVDPIVIGGYVRVFVHDPDADEDDAENQLYYAYRFRREPRGPWFAAVAGPYPVSGGVDTIGLDTGTRYTLWSAATPAEHVAAIRRD